MLNDYLKTLISEYADDELDLETTRQVSDFIAENSEAEGYFNKLQSLRRLTTEHLREEAEDPTLELRMMNALRLRSYEQTWWERVFASRALSPRKATAVALVIIVIVLFLFSYFQAPVSRFLADTRTRVEQLGGEAQTELTERRDELTESLGELLAPPSPDEEEGERTTSATEPEVSVA
ncbi:hypothetical protein J7J84_02345 [bacterium]|nr:hypothetical protein [bacterium]